MHAGKIRTVIRSGMKVQVNEVQVPEVGQVSTNGESKEDRWEKEWKGRKYVSGNLRKHSSFIIYNAMKQSQYRVKISPLEDGDQNNTEEYFKTETKERPREFRFSRWTQWRIDRSEGGLELIVNMPNARKGLKLTMMSCGLISFLHGTTGWLLLLPPHFSIPVRSN